MMILGVLLEMLGQVLDTVGQQGNLHLTGTGVRIMGFEFFDNFFFLYS
jgi:hypothetical protein